MPKQPTTRRTLELPWTLTKTLTKEAKGKGISLNALIRDILERSAAQNQKKE